MFHVGTKLDERCGGVVRLFFGEKLGLFKLTFDLVQLSLSSKVTFDADDAKIYRTFIDQNDTAALQDDINKDDIDKVSEYFTSWHKT